MHNLGHTVVLIDKWLWFKHTTLVFWCVWRSPTPPNSSGNVQKHGHLLRFQVNGRYGKINGVHVIARIHKRPFAFGSNATRYGVVLFHVPYGFAYYEVWNIR